MAGKNHKQAKGATVDEEGTYEGVAPNEGPRADGACPEPGLGGKRPVPEQGRQEGASRGVQHELELEPTST